MTRSLNGNLLFGLVAIGAGLFLLSDAWNAEGSPDDMIFPQVILSLIIAFGALLIIAEMKNVFAAHSNESISYSSWKSLSAFLLACVYPFAAFEFGFYFTTLVFLTLVPLFFIRRDPESGDETPLLLQLIKQLLSAATVTAALYLSFNIILKFSMPSGLIF